MEAGKNSVIYMGLVPGPNKAENICGKTNVTGTMQRVSTVYVCASYPISQLYVPVDHKLACCCLLHTFTWKSGKN
jgi:hypothetical protein